MLGYAEPVMVSGPKALGALVGTALLGLGEGAASAEDWLRVTSSEHCSIAPAVLEQRVASSLVGQRDPELRVAVALADERAGTVAAVRVARGAQVLGQKEIMSSRCSEALEAVVAVVALAVGAAAIEPQTTASSAAPVETPAATPADRAAPPSPGGARARTAPASPEDAGSVDDEASRTSPARWRLLLGAGADRGVLSAATAVVGAGAALSLGLAEWRAQLWYGLPVSFERDEDGRVDRERSDFAAAAFDHCRSLAGARWLSLCAGLEGRLARVSRVSTSPVGARTDGERLEPGAAARASAALVFPALGWQPRLEVGTLVPVVGTSADPVGIRAAFGTALPF